MEKIFKTKEVFTKNNPNRSITWKDVKDFKFEDDDIINSGYDPPEHGENYGHDGYFYFSVQRQVLETDEEFELRKKCSEMEVERQKKNRYQRYLKLKEEFENGI
jgi:hypothetical protein